MSKTFVRYIPHGINTNSFHRVTDEAGLARLKNLRAELFGPDNEVDFVVLYNNRNIQRKRTGDVVLAYKTFYETLTPEQQRRSRLVLHTQPVDENGTDLIRLINDVAPNIEVVFSPHRVETQTINDIYNVSDVVINLASNEGFGLGTLEALLAERIIIVNVTGGLQDQCGFRDEKGNFLHEDEHYTAEWGSNHDGRYTTHGEWVLPIFPATRSLMGSPPTPYIFDDRCRWEDAAESIRQAYDMGKAERDRRGTLGREYAIEQGFTAEAMCQGFIDGIDAVLSQWKPRERFTLFRA